MMMDISWLGSFGWLGGSRSGTASAGANLKASLISWWSLDETSAGTAAVTRNDSHSTNHLTDNNTTASGTGIKSNGADLEFSNQERLTIADNASLSMGDIDFTLCAWAKFESAPANSQGRAIVSKYNFTTNNREYLLLYERIDASSINHLRFVVSNNGTASTTVNSYTTGTPSIGTWYFVVAWHDATDNTINIQVNNGAADGTAHSTGVFNGTAIFEVGGLNAGATFYMDGILDEVAIWKRTLTAAERAWLYNSGSGRAYSELG